MIHRLEYTVEFYTRNAMGGRKYQGAAGFHPNMPKEVRQAIKLTEWAATDHWVNGNRR